MASESSLGGGDRARQAYLEYLLGRLKAPRHFVKEAIRARSQRV
jgi:hypothetical protein